MFKTKMMPGETPYTAAELRRLSTMIAEAAAGDPGEMEEPVIAFADPSYQECGSWLWAQGFRPEPGTSRWRHSDGRVGRICEAPRDAWRVETVKKGDS